MLFVISATIPSALISDGSRVLSLDTSVSPSVVGVLRYDAIDREDCGRVRNSFAIARIRAYSLSHLMWQAVEGRNPSRRRDGDGITVLVFYICHNSFIAK